MAASRSSSLRLIPGRSCWQDEYAASASWRYFAEEPPLLPETPPLPEPELPLTPAPPEAGGEAACEAPELPVPPLGEVPPEGLVALLSEPLDEGLEESDAEDDERLVEELDDDEALRATEGVGVELLELDCLLALPQPPRTRAPRMALRASVFTFDGLLSRLRHPARWRERST